MCVCVDMSVDSSMPLHVLVSYLASTITSVNLLVSAYCSWKVVSDQFILVALQYTSYRGCRHAPSWGSTL